MCEDLAVATRTALAAAVCFNLAAPVRFAAFPICAQFPFGPVCRSAQAVINMFVSL